VGSTPFLAATFVSAIVDRLSRRYPRIVFRLVTATTAHAETLHRELTDRNVDLLITRRSGPMTDERLDYEFLFKDSFSIVVGAKSPLVRRRSIALADLMDEPWVLPPPHSVIASVALEAFRRRARLSPRDRYHRTRRRTHQFTGDRAVYFDFLRRGLEIFRPEP